jgi:hypothetical protein
MRVKRHRSGTLETCVQMRDIRVENAERSVGPIDMQPEALLGTEIRQLIEWIHSTGIDRSGTPHYAKRSAAFLTISHNRLVQSRQDHFVAIINRDDARLSKTQEM